MSRSTSVLVFASLALVVVLACLLAPGSTPRAAVRASEAAGIAESGLSELWCQNMDYWWEAYVAAAFRRQPDSAAVTVEDWSLWAWASRDFVTLGGASLPLGAHSVIVDADSPLACAVRTDWRTSGAAVAHTQSESGSDLLVPVVFKAYDGLSSIITVQNSFAWATTTATIDVLAQDSTLLPVATTTVELAPGASRSFRIGSDAAFGTVPTGFLGWARVTSPDSVAVNAIVDDTTSPLGAFGFEGVPAASASPTLYAGEYLADAWLDPASSAAGHGATRLAVLNPSDQAAQVTVTYDGADGLCGGQTYAQGPQTIDAHNIFFFDPPGVGPDILPSPLPQPCRAAATIQSSGADVVAVAMTYGVDPEYHARAAYNAVPAGGYTVAVPFWRKAYAPDGQASSVIQAYNYGDTVADAYLFLEDSDGYGVYCGSDCWVMIPPHSAHAWSMSELSTVDPGMAGSAVVDSYEPVAVVVSEVSLDRSVDLVSYLGINDPSDYSSYNPLVLVETAPPTPTIDWGPYPPPATETPTVTSTVTRTSTPTATYPPRVTSTPTPTATPQYQGPEACKSLTPKLDPAIQGRVPPVAITDGLANPWRIAGWCVPQNPNVPFHPLFNPYRVCLTMKNQGIPYHPIYNSLVYKAGCR